MQNLGQYYTANIFSQLLVNSISSSNPQCILELGVGEGSLLKAAYSRWSDASYYVSDIDKKSLNKLKEELPFIKSFHLDVLKENIFEKISLDSNEVDIALCNPPYLRVGKLGNYTKLFEDANLKECKNLLYLTSDIIFLAKNLQILKDSGELGIILPDGLITGNDFKNLRFSILKSHNVKAVIQLPEKIFQKTEALTHILIIEKGKTSSSNVPLFLADIEGKIIDQIDSEKDSLIERMDFKYHSWKQNNNLKSTGLTLKSIGAEIRRGQSTHSELKASNSFFLHTTNISHNNSHLVTTENRVESTLCAEEGDIILSRVGVIGKAAMISEGCAPISDCLYRIRVSDSYRISVWNSLTSRAGQEWLLAKSHGVCAQVTSKSDLLDFPVNVGLDSPDLNENQLDVE
ncbi:hypothetical protein GCM10027341_56510 [Spirosoma knui]